MADIFGIKSAFKPMHVAGGVKSSRFIEPRGCEELPEWRVKYANAEKLADDVGEVPLNFRAFCLLDGKFIFGDFIEALIVRNNWDCEELTISTLSMSQDNVDSLANLLNGGFLRQLNIIVSHYHFSNERGRGGLMPYLYEKLDINNALQVAVARVHTKIAMIRTACGKKITIHGSANLRTSSNIEQIVIEHSPALFDFCASAHHGIIEAHKTINKPVRRTALWSAVLGDDQCQAEAMAAAQSTTETHLEDGRQSAKQSLQRQKRKSANQRASNKAGV